VSDLYTYISYLVNSILCHEWISEFSRANYYLYTQRPRNPIAVTIQDRKNEIVASYEKYRNLNNNITVDESGQVLRLTQ